MISPNKANSADAKNRAADLRRVCQAWHVASKVKDLAPGVRGA